MKREIGIPIGEFIAKNLRELEATTVFIGCTSYRNGKARWIEGIRPRPAFMTIREIAEAFQNPAEYSSVKHDKIRAIKIRRNGDIFIECEGILF